MATTTNTGWVTLTDLWKVIGPDMQIQAIAPLLMQNNTIIQDMAWMVSNAPTYNQTTQQSSLPASTRAKINQAVTGTKMTTEQVTDVMEMHKAFCPIAVDLLEINAANEKYRAIQDAGHIEGMGQTAHTDIFYANTNQDPEAMLGLAARYSDPANSKYGGDQMINAAGDGVGAQTSIWLVDHAEDAFCGIYPKGTKAGLDFTDHGTQVVGNHTDGFLTIKLSEFRWRLGVAVPNPKHVVRICNVDVADMTAGTAIGLPELMIEAEERMPEVQRGRRMFYMNRLTRTSLRKEARKEANVQVNFEWGDLMGEKVMMWNGIPVRRADAILNTETIVTGF